MTAIVDSIVGISLLVAIVGFGVRSAPVHQDSHAAARAAYRTGGLKAAAKAAGGHYATLTDWQTEEQYDDWVRLVDTAEVIMIGDILENTSHLSRNGDYITTDYKLYVRETLKGDIAPHSRAVFQVMGGRFVFEDGSIATMETKGFVRPNTGARVVIFGRVLTNDTYTTDAVRAYAEGSPVLGLVGLSRGIVELPTDEREKVKVKATGAKDKLSHRTRKQDARALLDDVQKAMKEAEKKRAKAAGH